MKASLYSESAIEDLQEQRTQDIPAPERVVGSV